jgi:hypothetical protein
MCFFRVAKESDSGKCLLQLTSHKELLHKVSDAVIENRGEQTPHVCTFDIENLYFSCFPI